ncbi:MAG: hypothetical protein M3Y72_20885 [Acidobacteriota bacterium]|nr:hypothetical protein [Acidobacteriota bacterium]
MLGFPARKNRQRGIGSHPVPWHFLEPLAVLAIVVFLHPACSPKHATPSSTPIAGTSTTAQTAKPKSPAPPLTWADCVKIKGSVIEQTYPEICAAPDGRKAVKPPQ